MNRLNFVFKFAVLVVFVGGLNFVGNSLKGEVFAMESCEPEVNDLQKEVEELAFFEPEINILKVNGRVLEVFLEKFKKDLSLVKSIYSDYLKSNDIMKKQDEKPLSKAELEMLNEKEKYLKLMCDVLGEMCGNLSKKLSQSTDNKIDFKKDESANSVNKKSMKAYKKVIQVSNKYSDVEKQVKQFLKEENSKKLSLRLINKYFENLGQLIHSQLELFNTEFSSFSRSLTRNIQLYSHSLDFGKIFEDVKAYYCCIDDLDLVVRCMKRYKGEVFASNAELKKEVYNTIKECDCDVEDDKDE